MNVKLFCLLVSAVFLCVIQDSKTVRGMAVISKEDNKASVIALKPTSPASTTKPPVKTTTKSVSRVIVARCRPFCRLKSNGDYRKTCFSFRRRRLCVICRFVFKCGRRTSPVYI